MANRKCTIYGGSVLARSTLGDLDSGLEGAESAKRDETPRSIYDWPLASAWTLFGARLRGAETKTCMHACRRVCLHLCVHACIHTLIHACMHAHMCICVYVYVYVHACVCVCTSVLVRIPYTCTYTHVPVHVHVRACMCMFTCVRACGCMHISLSICLSLSLYIYIYMYSCQWYHTGALRTTSSCAFMFGSSLAARFFNCVLYRCVLLSLSLPPALTLRRHYARNIIGSLCSMCRVSTCRTSWPSARLPTSDYNYDWSSANGLIITIITITNNTYSISHIQYTTNDDWYIILWITMFTMITNKSESAGGFLQLLPQVVLGLASAACAHAAC